MPRRSPPSSSRIAPASSTNTGAWLVEITVRHVRIVFQAGHREEVVAIRGLPHVDEPGHPLAVIPQIAGPDFHPARRAVMRMTGNAQCALPPDLLKDLLGRLIGADPLPQIQSHDVRVFLAPDVVLRDLRTWNDEHAVDALGADRFALDLVQIPAETILGHRVIAV